MAHAEVPSFHNPLERLGHTVHEIPAWMGRHYKSLSLAAAAFGAAGYFLITHDRGIQAPPIRPTTGVSDPFKPASGWPDGQEGKMPSEQALEQFLTPTPEPTLTPPPKPPEPTPTLEPPKPTATATSEATTTSTATASSTPEAKIDIPCGILPAEYCSQGEVIYTKNSQGGPEIYIGFNDLPDNMPIFAGRKGQKLPVKLAPGSEFQGFRVTVMDANLGFSPSEVAFGVIGDLDLGNTLSLPVEKGDIVAKIKNTGIKNLGYGLLITAKYPRPIPAETILRQLFPGPFAKPAKILPYQGPANPTPNISSLFTNAPTK